MKEVSMAPVTHVTPNPELRRMLDEHRGELKETIEWRIARIREDGSNARPAGESEEGDTSDLDVRLLEIAVATLRRIDAAIERLDHGTYGRCSRCRGAIAEARLRAMPFAVCCRQCEIAREVESRCLRADARKRLVWAEGVVLPESC
jgi:DnaK suppressor protein